jgi:hypothetical protein
MVSLVDIVPQTRTVTIAGGDIELRGLGLRQIAGLLVRFPELRKLLVEGAPELDLDALFLAAPDAVGAIIAAAAGQPEAAGTIADVLPLEDVAECLVAIRDLTMPRGPGPLFDRLAHLVGSDPALGLAGKAAATNAPPPPSNSSPPDMLAAK